jgi:phage tail-like protein
MINSDQPTYFVRDPAFGWYSETSHLSPAPDGGLAVDCVPGQPKPFAKSLSDKIKRPIALAAGNKYEFVYLIDQETSRIQRIDLRLQQQITDLNCESVFQDTPVTRPSKPQPAGCRDLEFSILPGIGGEGRGARQLLKPRGLAVLSDGAIAVADTGNHQVKIFSSFPHSLLAVWGSGKPGSSLGVFNRPGKVAADACGLIYIADHGNGRIQRIQRDGTPREPITGLTKPQSIAVRPDGTTAVLDGNRLLLFAQNATESSKEFKVPGGTCLTFDNVGSLYAGTSGGLIYKFVNDEGGTLRDAGIGVTGHDANLLDLLWVPGGQLIGIMLEKYNATPSLWSLCACASFTGSEADDSDLSSAGSGNDDRQVRLNTGGVGTLTTEPLDSGVEKCVWHRIELDATIPPGTVIEVATQTWEDSSKPPQKGAGFVDSGFSYGSADTKARVSLTGDNPDCLVQSGPGRYMRVRVILRASGVASPVLRGIRIHFPRQSYLQYLPVVYQENDESRLFLERFLSIFQTTFDNLDRTVDDIWMMFDSSSVPNKWFPWLAAWISLPLNPQWFKKGQTDSLKPGRDALTRAGQLYPKRGTRAGMEEVIREYTGAIAPPRLVEHFRLRQLVILGDRADQPSTGAFVTQLGASPLCNGTRLWSRDYYQRLQVGVYSRLGYFRLTGEPEPGLEPLAWGANEFSVFFDCEPYEVNVKKQALIAVVEREKPAHTKANYCPVLPRMRVGVQCTLGIDTRVGDITPLLLGTTGTLGYDSILACSTAQMALRQFHTANQPQVEVTTRLQ